MTSAEKTALGTETMTKNGRTYTFADGYDYLKSYWTAHGIGSNTQRSIVQNNKTIIVVAVISVLLLSFISFFVIQKKKKQKQ